MKSFIFWNITQCNPLKVNRRFGGTCQLHLQSRRINRAEHTCFRVGFLLDLFLDPEDGCDMFLQNFGWISADYKELHPIRHNSSISELLACKSTRHFIRGKHLTWIWFQWAIYIFRNLFVAYKYLFLFTGDNGKTGLLSVVENFERCYSGLTGRITMTAV
jgi:hypothetical protein